MIRNKWLLPAVVFILCFVSIVSASLAASDSVKIALNYPETGPYAKEGKDEWYGAELARKEINAAGGILGKEIVYRWFDSASNTNHRSGESEDGFRRRFQCSGHRLCQTVPGEGRSLFRDPYLFDSHDR